MANKNKYQFESKIHVYRATKRMTQQELADLVGVSRQTVMQLESVHAACLQHSAGV